jgi:chromate transporter
MSRASAGALAVVFLPLSFATIGGGQSAIAGIRHQVVDVNHWLTAEQFLNAFAVSRLAPGPGSLLVTLIGWQVGGLLGAVAATLAIFVPTSILIFAVARLWARHRGARWQIALEAGLRPIAAGLILAAVYALLLDQVGGWAAQMIIVGATAILLARRVSPLPVIGGGVAAACLFHAIGILPVA